MNTNELDIRVIFAVIRRQLIWILVMAVLGAFIAFMIANYLIPAKYSSDTQVLITNRQADRVSLTDLSTAKSMASTYCVLLTSPEAKDRLVEKLTTIRYAESLAESEAEGIILSKKEQELVRDEINSAVSSEVSSCSFKAKVVSSTEVVELSVVSGSATRSAEVCMALAEVAKDWVPEIYGADSSSTTLKKNITPSTSPSSPNLSVAIALGAVAGIALVCGIATIVYLSDNRVKDEADFTAKVGVPVLGAVPNMDETGERKEREAGENNYFKKKDK